MSPDRLSTTLAAIADPTRRRILDTLRDGAADVSTLVGRLSVSQPLLSKHLSVLRDAGTVRVEVSGWVGDTSSPWETPAWAATSPIVTLGWGMPHSITPWITVSITLSITIDIRGAPRYFWPLTHVGTNREERSR